MVFYTIGGGSSLDHYRKLSFSDYIDRNSLDLLLSVNALLEKKHVLFARFYGNTIFTVFNISYLSYHLFRPYHLQLLQFSFVQDPVLVYSFRSIPAVPGIAVAGISCLLFQAKERNVATVIFVYRWNLRHEGKYVPEQ